MDLKNLEEIDSKKMYEIYDIWPDIARETFETNYEKLDIKDIDHIVFAGMGGSGSVGDTIGAILSKEDVHVTNIKGYVLPKTVDSNTLIIATSVSGNTSETMEIIKLATKTSAKTIGFSSGGKMSDFCRNNNVFYQNIPMIHSPRASFTSFLFSILNIMMRIFLKLFIFAMPFVALYLIMDPFRVLRSYDDYLKGWLVEINQNYVSTEVYLKNHIRYGYDSFIFGSSRTMGYRTNDWKMYLGEGSSPFVFKSSSYPPTL